MFKNKYLKYKKKYLEIKKMHGGAFCDIAQQGNLDNMVITTALINKCMIYVNNPNKDIII